MSSELRDSYVYCRDLARRAGNFYYAFLTLPSDQYWAMCALYGFTRLVDDTADEENLPLDERRRRLQAWRENLATAIKQPQTACSTASLVFPAIIETLQIYKIPPQYLFDLIDGVESDLDPAGFETFDDLSRYCYRVAGVIGLCCIHIWGFTDPRALTTAEVAGQAFQLTNILRDLKEDLANGRCYIPRQDLVRHGCELSELQAGRLSSAVRQLLAFEVSRARELYRRGTELTEYLSDTGIPPFRTMVRLYEGILNEIERAGYDVFSRRIRVPAWRKMQFALSGIWEQYLPRVRRV